MKLQMSIRLKFMILVGLSFTVALVAILISTRNVYIQDKEAYLYDDLLTSTNNDAKFLSEFISSKRITSKLIFSNSAFRKLKDSKADLALPKQFFIDNPSLIDFRLYRYGNKEFLLENEILNNSMKEFVENPNELFESGNKMTSFLFLVKEALSISDVFLDKNGLVQLRVGYYNKDLRFLGLFRFNLSFFISKLSFGQSYSKVLINQEGQVLYSNYNNVDKSLELNLSNESVLHSELQKQMINSGVKPIELSKGRYFVGFSKVPEMGITQVSLLGEKVAYKTIDILIVRTLRIALFTYVGIFILVALFSDTITRSLKDLIQATKDAVEGNYRKTIELNSGDEVGMLVNTFNEMISKVQAVTSKLQEANKNLEDKVAKRTADLKTSNDFINAMINSLDQGLFVFTSTGKVLPIYTKSCQKFFGNNFSTKNAVDILGFKSADEGKKLIKNMYREMIPFESVAELAPRHVGNENRDVEDPDFFQGSLKYFPMRTDEGEVQFIVVVATDITREFKANNLALKQKAYVERILKMVRAKNNFLIFIKETESNLSEAKNHIQKEQENFDVALLMRIFHSIKGMAGQFSAIELSEYVHNLESEVSHFESADAKEKKNFYPELSQKIQAVENLVLAVKEDGKEVIGPAIVDGIPREEIPRNVLQDFRVQLELGLTPDKQEILDNFDIKFLKVPIKTYFENYNHLLKDLSHKLGKKVNPIKFQNGELLVDKLFYQPIFNNFVHIFRNIADHGIETPDERMEQGKDPYGSITIEFEVVRKKIEIRVIDDGKGIDPDRIRDRMRDKGYSEEMISEPDDQVITHVFDANFSTKDEVSAVSGRGAGMDAVKDIVEKNGGAARVTSKLGQGTTFKFRLPLQ